MTSSLSLMTNLPSVSLLVDQGEIVSLSPISNNAIPDINATWLAVITLDPMSPNEQDTILSHINYAWKVLAAAPLELVSGHWPDDGRVILCRCNLYTSASSDARVAIINRFIPTLVNNLANGTPPYMTTRKGSIGEQALSPSSHFATVWMDKVSVV